MSQARGAALGLDHGAGGRPDRADGATRWRGCSSAATRSSTAATRAGPTTSAARRSCAPKGLHYVDVGVSGGVWGLEVGYCMMVGGPDEAVERLAPILDVLAPPHTEEHGPGWGHFGPTGAGHYVKMVHNGVEYGMMQAYAEGFSLFDACEYELDNAKIAHLWMQGSVVRSWLCELAALAFEQEGNDLDAARALRGGLGRGPLDGRGRDRQAHPDAGDHDVAVRALLLARAERLRRQGQRGAAQPVRRPRRARPPTRWRRRSRTRSSRWPTVEQQPTRSSRASSGCPSTRRRWSSSAAPATSPTASCCRRSTTSRTRARCPSAST